MTNTAQAHRATASAYREARDAAPNAYQAARYNQRAVWHDRHARRLERNA